MKRRRDLAPEERSLWRNVTKDVAPLHRETVLSPSGTVTEKLPPGAPHGDMMAALPPQKATTLGPGRRHAQTSACSGDAFGAGDPRSDRHAARGRTPIDATLDLHGHTQISAHGVFRAFIHSARSRGYRCVLIITGKGDPSSGRGVLRARLRDWINEPGLRRQVTRVSQSHPRHGGSGAFYIFLKSDQKAPRSQNKTP